MAKDRAKVLNQIVRKIPLFMGLSPSQMDIMLKVCHVKPFEAGEVICASNTDATVEAGSGEEALEALGQQPADLVITDIRMDGHGLLDKVKEQFPQLPVLAISGVVDGDEMRHYAFDGVMEKPLDIEELRDLVDEAVER
ncbi:MAG: response regulator [Candidatus Latescibacterota bacterium]|nr:response regulator [Candidatus Latescibacterota bacterium]